MLDIIFGHYNFIYSKSIYFQYNCILKIIKRFKGVYFETQFLNLSPQRYGFKIDGPNGGKENAMERCKRCEITLLLHTIYPFSLARTHTRYPCTEDRNTEKEHEREYENKKNWQVNTGDFVWLCYVLARTVFHIPMSNNFCPKHKEWI